MMMGGRVGRARGMGREEREGVFDWGGWEERVDGWMGNEVQHVLIVFCQPFKTIPL